MNNIDEADLRILRAVQRDSTRSTAELAETVGLSQPACWRRLQRLRQEGHIMRETALLDREKLGFSTQMFATVKLDVTARGNLEAFAAAIRAMPEIVEGFLLLGTADFMLRIVTRDIHEYERFMVERLSAIPGVRDITTAVVLSEIKPAAGLPI